MNDAAPHPPPAVPSAAELQAILHAGVPLAGAWGVEVLEALAGRALLRLPSPRCCCGPAGRSPARR